jgi:hypothetical protein
VNIALSGTLAANNQPIVDFLTGNFADVTVTFGDFSNPATIPAGTDVFIVGRILSSGAYDNAVNSAIFNSLNIPVVAFTSYVARTEGSRWSWHQGSVNNALDVGGDETTITAAGAPLLGAAGAADWWTVGTGGTGFNAAGVGPGVGTGSVLATIGGSLLVAAWEPGQQSAGGVVFTANRLLFNLPDSTFVDGSALLPDSTAGQQALLAALAAYTPLQIIPEPSSIALLGMGVLMTIRRTRRRLRK